MLVNHKLQKCLDYVHECHSASCPGQSAEPRPVRVAESAVSDFLGTTTSRPDNATGRGEASSWTDTVEFSFIGTPEQLDDSTTSSSSTTDGADEQQVHKIQFSSRSPSLPRSSESPVGLSPRSEANHQHFVSHEIHLFSPQPIAFATRDDDADRRPAIPSQPLAPVLCALSRYDGSVGSWPAHARGDRCRGGQLVESGGQR